MRPSVLNKLYIIVERQLDASILRSILDCNEYEEVYQYISNGFNNLPSICQTLRYRLENRDKMVIVFDTDSTDTDTINNMISILNFLISPEKTNNSIGIFDMVPNLDTVLKLDKHDDIAKLSQIIKERLDELKKIPVIIEIQKFIDL